MRRTLFTIDHEIAGLPVLGFGWIFALLVVAGLVYLAFAARNPALREELPQRAMGWLTAVLVVVFVGPAIELRSITGEPVGLAVRGYGVMMLAGVVSGIALAAHRARRQGIGVDHIYALALWLLVGGLAGARLFYVVQYPDRILTPGMGGFEAVAAILNFTGGGLVVYGSIIGGFLAGLVYCFRQHLPPLRVGDVVIPSLFIGMFFGRLGCLLNGCCYGGQCEEGPWALHFPPGSPVYAEQLSSGDLVGIELAGDPSVKKKSLTLPARIVAVRAGSPAAEEGIRPGQTVRLLERVRPQPSEADATRPADDTSGFGLLAEIDGREYYWSAGELPRQSLPVRPAQLVSSLSSLALAGLVLAIAPFIRREGLLMAIGFSGYAILRFGLEMIRSDEAGQFGTSLTISQWVSIFVLIAMAGLIAWIFLRPSVSRRSDEQRRYASRADA